MSENPPRAPDFNLVLINKTTGERNNRAGAAWKNPDGTIALRLSPFMLIPSHAGLVMMLFPTEHVNADSTKVSTSS